MTLTGPSFGPVSGGRPKQLVVILHGYGADGNDLIGLGEVWGEALPEALFVAPNGPAPCADFPAGRQWFPVTMEMLQHARLDGARGAGPVVEGYLRDLWARSGLGPAETVLAGFSQGAMMALHVGLGLDEPVAGILAYSGALIPPGRYASRPPVLLLHGDLDPIVDPELGRQALTALKAEGYDVELVVSPGIGHSISPEGLEAGGAFLVRVLRP